MRTNTLRPLLLFALFLQSCGGGFRPSYDSTSLGSTLSICEIKHRQAFRDTYKPFLRTNCAACHASGGVGKGSFSDASESMSYGSFAITDIAKINTNSVSTNHAPPYSNPGLQTTISQIYPAWLQADRDFQTCTTLGVVGPDQEIPSGARLVTVGKPLSVVAAPTTVGTPGNATTVTFNLNTELLSNDLKVSGATLRVQVARNITVTGQTSYILTNPRLTTTEKAYLIKDLQVIFSNTPYVNGTTFMTVNRRVPITDAGGGRTLSSGGLIIDAAIATTDTLAFSIGSMTEIKFTPPTFAQLNAAASGMFALNCTTCHGATNPIGGLNMSTRQSIINSFSVIPFDPAGSELLKRMRDPARPMPVTGLLNDAAAQNIEDWILDGAP